MVLGTIVGAVAGFVGGVLLAPKSGKETRKDIKDVAVKGKDRVVSEAEHLKDVASHKAEDLKATADKVKSRVEKTAKDIKKDIAKKPAKKK